jgi:hypothetical protein
MVAASKSSLKERLSRSVQIKLTVTGWKLPRSKRIQFQSPVNRLTRQRKMKAEQRENNCCSTVTLLTVRTVMQATNFANRNNFADRLYGSWIW